MFWTVVNELKSPENAGMIVRSHVAFGGEEILVIGPLQSDPRRAGQLFVRAGPLHRAQSGAGNHGEASPPMGVEQLQRDHRNVSGC